MAEVTVMAPVASLGARGIHPPAFERALEHDPDVIALDSGSLDFGPYYLGTGAQYSPAGQMKDDLGHLVPAAADRSVPLIIGSAGSGGARPHVAFVLQDIEGVAAEHGLDLDVAVLASDVDPDGLVDRLGTSTITPIGHDDPLTEKDIRASDHIVCQMGIEPILGALRTDPDIVLCGRACDNAVLAAYPVSEGLPKGLSLHMGTILECGDFATEPRPGQHESVESETDAEFPILATIDDEGFTVRPADGRLRCTEETIAAHALYESGDPYRSAEPGGVLDLTGSTYEQVDDGAVRVTGSEFVPDEDYSVKLEGAGVVGHRAVSVMGVREPAMIEHIDDILEGLSEVVTRKFEEMRDVPTDIRYRIYGRDGAMGEWEPEQEDVGHELGVVVEVISDTQENAREICTSYVMRVMHGRFEGHIPESGTVALPFSPYVLDVNEFVDLTIHHAVTLDRPSELVSIDRLHLPDDAGEWR